MASAASGLPISSSNEFAAASEAKSDADATTLSLLFGDAVPPKLPVKGSKSKPRKSNLETALGCQNFVCLLSKYDLTKTDTGYILQPYEDTVKRSGKECKRFDCWLAQFYSKEKSYGLELIFKAAKEDEEGAAAHSATTAANLIDGHATSKASQPSDIDWPLDIIGDLLPSSSSQANQQKSPILEYDALFAKT
jgi:hypothetical protein